MQNQLLWGRRLLTYPARHLRRRKMLNEHQSPTAILHFVGGIGDQLLLTCVARQLRQNGEKQIWIASQHPDLFKGNRDVDLVISKDDLDWMLKNSAARLISPNYAPHLAEERRDIPPSKHILALMCEQAKLKGLIQLRPYLFLDDEEKTTGRYSDRQIAIQSSGRSAKHHMRTKEWYPERFQEVVNQLKSRFDFVQIGNENDPPLKGALDLRGKSNIRQTAAILAASKLFVGLVGFPMHLARAVDCPAVCVYGGRELPSQTGYICNVNLVGETSCSPCWRWDDCPGNHVCMDQIKSSAVVSAIETQMQKPGDELPVETHVL
jgi:ADP-heptose:LPS heptosyltransferase